jgi:hypothetical protein
MGLESIEDIPDSISTMIDDIANIEGVNVGDKIGLDTDIGQKINAVASEAANAVYAATGNVAQATAAYNAALSAMGMVETGKLVAETYTVTQETPPGFTPAENGSYTDAQGNTYTGVKFIPGAPNVI